MVISLTTTPMMAAVQSIVTRLDGIPLAIEMAAARTRALTIAEIDKRLDNAFRLLAVPGGDLLPRHQTLRAALDWSYDLLSEGEKTLLARLSVFAGGWTLAAAEAVCAGGGIAENDVSDLLASLIEKSLTQFQFDSGDPDDEARYRMLETVRQYGAERLSASGEAASVWERHIAHFVAIAEEAEPHLDGTEQLMWLNRLETEHDNLRAALGACEAAVSALSGLRLSGALLRFWEARGYLTEGRAHLARALARRHTAEQAAESGTADASAVQRAVAGALLAAGIAAKHQGDSSAARRLMEECLAFYYEMDDKKGIAKTLTFLGNVTQNQGDYPGARSLYEDSLALYQEIGDKNGSGRALMNLGNVALYLGDYPRARSLYEESLVLRRAVGEKTGIAAVLNNMGLTALYQSDYREARSLYEQSLPLVREIGDRQVIGNTLNNMGLIAIYQEDYVMARSLYEECLALTQEIDDKQGISRALQNLGNIAEKQGDHPMARSFFGKSLRLSREAGDKQSIAQGLQNIATVCVHTVDESRQTASMRRGVTLCAASTALFANIGVPIPPIEQAGVNEWLAEIRATLNDGAAFAAAWAEGTALSWEQAVELALNE